MSRHDNQPSHDIQLFDDFLAHESFSIDTPNTFHFPDPISDLHVHADERETFDVSETVMSLTGERARLKTEQFMYLTRLGETDPIIGHDACLVIDALCAIPAQMTRRETFPCFIHPHWGRKLPESLTICMHLAQMYTSRSMEIRPFIWRSILAEQTRVKQQARTKR